MQYPHSLPPKERTALGYHFRSTSGTKGMRCNTNVAKSFFGSRIIEHGNKPPPDVFRVRSWGVWSIIHHRNTQPWDASVRPFPRVVLISRLAKCSMIRSFFFNQSEAVYDKDIRPRLNPRSLADAWQCFATHLVLRNCMYFFFIRK